MIQDPRSRHSLNRLQCTTAQLLFQLIKDQLFIGTTTSMGALCDLQATMLSSKHIGYKMQSIATGEKKDFPIASNCSLARLSTNLPTAAEGEI